MNKNYSILSFTIKSPITVKSALFPKTVLLILGLGLRSECLGKNLKTQRCCCSVVVSILCGILILANMCSLLRQCTRWRSGNGIEHSKPQRLLRLCEPSRRQDKNVVQYVVLENQFDYI